MLSITWRDRVLPGRKHLLGTPLASPFGFSNSCVSPFGWGSRSGCWLSPLGSFRSPPRGSGEGPGGSGPGFGASAGRAVGGSHGRPSSGCGTARAAGARTPPGPAAPSGPEEPPLGEPAAAAGRTPGGRRAERCGPRAPRLGCCERRRSRRQPSARRVKPSGRKPARKPREAVLPQADEPGHRLGFLSPPRKPILEGPSGIPGPTRGPGVRPPSRGGAFSFFFFSYFCTQAAPWPPSRAASPGNGGVLPGSAALGACGRKPASEGAGGGGARDGGRGVRRAAARSSAPAGR